MPEKLHMPPALSLPPTIQHLYTLFGEIAPAFDAVADEDAPEPYRSLLAHDDHMTVTLESHYGAPLGLTVIGSALGDRLYARKILLTAGDPGPVVQFGIMQFDFHHCSERVRDLILDEQTPLGRILIEHTELRHIDMHGLVRIDMDDDMAGLFALDGDRPSSVYGRLATIFCDHQPAVALLEVVRP